MDFVENITHGGKLLATIVRNSFKPEKTVFVTPHEFNLQIGYVVYTGGKEIARHVHLPIERRTTGTAEVIVVKSGSCEVDLFSQDRELVATRMMSQGDLLVMSGGGHGFRLLEDTVLLEIKQGPYPGVEEKERF